MTKEEKQDWMDALEGFAEDMSDISDAVGDLSSRIDATIGEMKPSGVGDHILQRLRLVVCLLDLFDNGDVDKGIAIARKDLKAVECEGNEKHNEYE